MQQTCNRFAMDLTDSRMGPEQRCRNCQFMKKEHTQTNSQQLPQNDQGINKVSDLKKKFSGGNNQIQDKFQGVVRQSLQFKNQEEQNPAQQNQISNQSDSTNIPIRKIESQTNYNDDTTQLSLNQKQVNLEKQQSNQSSQSNQSNQRSLNEQKQIEQQPKQQAQIETGSNQNKLANNPFLKKDKQQKDEKPNVSQAQPSQQQKLKEQPIIQKKSVQQPESTNVVCNDLIKQSKNQDTQNIVEKKSPLVQQNSTEPKQSLKEEKIENPIKDGAKNFYPIIGFGTPPIKKTSNLQESESQFEQQMIDRPAVQKINKRTVQKFSDLN